MTELPADRVHLSVADAQALGENAMRGVGHSAEEARILTDHVMDAALCGYEYSGLPKLLNVVDAAHFKKPRQQPRVVKESTVTALMDGGNQSGMIGLYHATHEAIRRAEAHGVAIVCMYNTWMSGRSAYYCEAIARAGLVAIHTVSSPAQVAPFGGAGPALGTNPIAFGFPAGEDPLVIDMGTSAFMATDLSLRERMGTPLPEGVALDPQGRPTTDAVQARLGTLLPFGGPEGGYKGFGIALAMDALGALCAGARQPGDVRGYMIIAFKPDLFLPLEDYRREVRERIAAVKAVPTQTGVSEIRIPGERGYRERQKLRREGIVIDRKIFDALGELVRGNLDHGAWAA
jgi:LDH2 family malate/lactate/ureidoglycolate dehydrogenase